MIDIGKKIKDKWIHMIPCTSKKTFHNNFAKPTNKASIFLIYFLNRNEPGYVIKEKGKR